ncbi:ABC transporter ATP-binding protein [Companilactobacillus mishanensis]|uniref:ABC transporter ATP-binding protein n=1 Tax=Companilactobacillus mishanensis TaxID=2486008 RepID=A0ABW9P986_9LACO|nr:ABC transporter ATP-binding protein [Companilactobacillus mishanensis]MQS45617.1 ABC transporter ATP-binding protein [Companilactobacillus mishanensis]MQS89021.1 ABC transporter ATP-binding protein [Companilactobacillus mishanensis]
MGKFVVQIIVKNVAKDFGKKKNAVHALKDISLEVEQGEFLGIMGPSGAGKTTLLDIISSNDRPDHGQVLIDDIDMTQQHDRELAKYRRRKMGFIYQSFELLDSLNVQENIILPLVLNHAPKKLIKQRVEHMNDLLNISELKNRSIDDLSLGQKQLIAAARALINNPEILFADEPTGSLDSKSATVLLNYMQMINQREKTTILMATHDAFTASYCSRVIFIKDGSVFSEIVNSGQRTDFFEQVINMQRTIGGGSYFNVPENN